MNYKRIPFRLDMTSVGESQPVFVDIEDYDVVSIHVAMGTSENFNGGVLSVWRTNFPNQPALAEALPSAWDLLVPGIYTIDRLDWVRCSHLMIFVTTAAGSPTIVDGIVSLKKLGFVVS